MINKLIWNKVEEMFYWNISVDSPINQLPFTMEFILACQKEFSMKVRDKEYPIHLGGIMDWHDKTMGDFVKEIDKHQLNAGDSNHLLYLLSENVRKFIYDNITLNSVYELFHYSSPKFDPDEALIEIKESTNNLNTRLSNLKKINKSLIRFEENSSSLNWEELQKISAELEDDYKDN